MAKQGNIDTIAILHQYNAATPASALGCPFNHLWRTVPCQQTLLAVSWPLIAYCTDPSCPLPGTHCPSDSSRTRPSTTCPRSPSAEVDSVSKPAQASSMTRSIIRRLVSLNCDSAFSTNATLTLSRSRFAGKSFLNHGCAYNSSAYYRHQTATLHRLSSTDTDNRTALRWQAAGEMGAKQHGDITVAQGRR